MGIIFKTLINRLLAQPIKTMITLVSICLGVMIVTICLNINVKLDSLISSNKENITINILSGNQSENGTDFDGEAVINDNILETIKTDFPEIINFSQLKETSNKFLYNNDQYSFGIAIAADSNFLINNNLTLLEGSNFLDNSKNSEVLISSNAAEIIFGDEDPIGKELSLISSDWNEEVKAITNNFYPKKVVGIYKSVDSLNKMLKGIPDIISSYNTSEYSGYLSFHVKTKSPDRFKAKLDEYFKVEFGEDRSFIVWEGHILSPFEDSQWFVESTQMMILFFTILGGVTLIVAAFSVFSMVMISVAERGREIGLKRALGSSKKSIILMFFIESSIFILIAAIPGVLLAGLFFPVVLDGTLPSITGGSVDLASNVDQHMEFFPIIISVGITMLLGSVVGIFPSITAVNVMPIETIRDN